MKKVALVLSSGGARGLAQIGAIEELEARGYEITSISGTSIGSLIGGLYASGGLPAYKKWVCSLRVPDIISLADVSVGLNHLVKGEKIVAALKKISPDVNIEDLPIPYCAVAGDIKNFKEVVFDKGSLYDAIRASISIPTFFRPMKVGDSVFIDGGAVNPLPLNRVHRTEGDILVSVDVSANIDSGDDEIKKLMTVHQRQDSFLRKAIMKMKPETDANSRDYVSLLSNTFSLMILQNSALTAQMYPPDISVNIAMNSFGSFDYDKADRIIAAGQVKMREALDKFEGLR